MAGASRHTCMTSNGRNGVPASQAYPRSVCARTAYRDVMGAAVPYGTLTSYGPGGSLRSRHPLADCKLFEVVHELIPMLFWNALERIHFLLFLERHQKVAHIWIAFPL